MLFALPASANAFFPSDPQIRASPPAFFGHSNRIGRRDENLFERVLFVAASRPCDDSYRFVSWNDLIYVSTRDKYNRGKVVFVRRQELKSDKEQGNLFTGRDGVCEKTLSGQ